jgi:NAD(P)-dependent dehydrogenase (short-subunit alcohol dehydrogenase family)
MTRRRRVIAGRPAVITGAASGIGRSLAQRLSRSGSPVAIADIDEGGLKQTAQSMPGPVLTRVLDVRDAADQAAFAAEVGGWLAGTAPGPEDARLAAVFNNAGVLVISSVADADPADDAWLWQVNVGGVVNGTRAFLPMLLRQGEGVIVNTSSMFGLAGMPYYSAYCASKFAIRGFTESLRAELRGTGVSAVTLHPGFVRTGLVRGSRVRTDPEGRGRGVSEVADGFEAFARMSPDHAAEIICRGVERGKERILVGSDARLLDILARVAPARSSSITGGPASRAPAGQAGSPSPAARG